MAYTDREKADVTLAIGGKAYTLDGTPVPDGLILDDPVLYVDPDPVGTICFSCVHRRNSVRNAEEFAARMGVGMFADPAPKMECKLHRGYGYERDESRVECRDYRADPGLSPAVGK